MRKINGVMLLVVLFVLSVPFLSFAQTGDERRTIMDKQCNEGDGKTCREMGNYFSMMKKDEVTAQGYYDKALVILEKECSQNKNMEACFWFAMVDFYNGKDKPKDRADSKLKRERLWERFEIACDGGCSYACDKLADSKYVKDTKKMKLYAEKAIKLAEKACKDGNIDQCSQAGFDYQSRNKDYAKAKKYYKLACDKGHSSACEFLAELLSPSMMMVPIKNLKDDLKEACKLRTKACELGNGFGCRMIGNMWLGGQCGSKDPQKADEYYKKEKDLE